MVISDNKCETEVVKFISYTGRYPNLCSGLLTLEIENKIYTFGRDYKTNTNGMYGAFWATGGNCGFLNNYSDSYVNHNEWAIHENQLPEELRKYVYEIDVAFNNNVQQGCCGGCL